MRQGARRHWLPRFRLAALGGVRFHPLFLLLIVAAAGVGLWREVVVLFLLLMLHELGHAATAHHLGYTVEEVSLLPFGGVAKLSYGSVGFVPRHEGLIAIAGPFVNLCIAGLGWGMSALDLWSPAFARSVIEINLWIVGFNLLPGLPLDGGRVFRAARARRVGYEQATREAYRMSFVIAAALLVFGAAALWAGYPHVGALVLGLFLLASAWRERRDVSMETVRFLDSKRRQGIRRAQPVRALAAPASATIRDVVRQFAPDRYHMVYVLDRTGAVRTIVEEDELIGAVFEGHWLESLETWLEL